MNFALGRLNLIRYKTHIYDIIITIQVLHKHFMGDGEAVLILLSTGGGGGSPEVGKTCL